MSSEFKISTDKVYIAISSDDGFRRRLRDAIGREVAKVAPDWPAAKVDRLADMACDYLVAFNTGDFETYWRFRVPTGRCFLPPEAADRLRKHILRRQAQAGVEYVNSENLEATKDPKKLLALVWKLMGPGVRERDMFQYMKSNSCFRAVVLDDVRLDTMSVSESEIGTASLEIGRMFKKRHTKGMVLQTGLFQPLPHFSSAVEKNPEGLQVVSIMLPLKLADGFELPVFIAAFWEPIEDRFLPVVYAPGNNTHGIPF